MLEHVIDQCEGTLNWTSSDTTNFTPIISLQESWDGTSSLKLTVNIAEAVGDKVYMDLARPINATNGFVEFRMKTTGKGQYLKVYVGEDDYTEYGQLVNNQDASNWNLVRIDVRSFSKKDGIKKMAFEIDNGSILFEDTGGDQLWNLIPISSFDIYIDRIVALLNETVDEGRSETNVAYSKEYDIRSIPSSGSITLPLSFIKKSVIDQLRVVASGNVTFDFYIFEKSTYADDDCIYRNKNILKRCDIGDLNLFYQDLMLQNKLWIKIVNNGAASATFKISIKATPKV